MSCHVGSVHMITSPHICMYYRQCILLIIFLFGYLSPKFLVPLRAQVCKATVDRRVASDYSQLKYHYPPALESSDELPKNLRKIYSTYEGSTKQDGQKRNLTVSVLFFGPRKSVSKVDSYEARVEVSVEALAEDLIELALLRQQKHSDIVFDAQPHECVLKVVGRQEYLIERKPISQYKVGRLLRVYVF